MNCRKYRAHNRTSRMVRRRKRNESSKAVRAILRQACWHFAHGRSYANDTISPISACNMGNISHRLPASVFSCHCFIIFTLHWARANTKRFGKDSTPRRRTSSKIPTHVRVRCRLVPHGTPSLDHQNSLLLYSHRWMRSAGLDRRSLSGGSEMSGRIMRSRSQRG